jgi:hypothetical protein
MRIDSLDELGGVRGDGRLTLGEAGRERNPDRHGTQVGLVEDVEGPLPGLGTGAQLATSVSG